MCSQPKEFRPLACPTYLPGSHTLGDWKLFPRFSTMVELPV